MQPYSMLIVKQNILSLFTHALSVHAAPGYKAVLILITSLVITPFFTVQQNNQARDCQMLL